MFEQNDSLYVHQAPANGLAEVHSWGNRFKLNSGLTPDISVIDSATRNFVKILHCAVGHRIELVSPQSVAIIEFCRKRMSFAPYVVRRQ